MESKLDADDKNRKRGMWVLLLVGVALAVVAGLYYASLEDQNALQDVVYANDSTSSNSASLENKVSQTDVKHEELIIENKKETIAADNVAIANETINTSSNVNANVVDNSITSSKELNLIHNVKASDKTISKSIVKTSVSNDDDLVTSIEIVGSGLSQKITTEKNQSTTKSNLISKNLLEIAALPNRNLILVGSSINKVENKQSKVEVIIAEDENKSNAASLLSKLSATLFVAPEWSSLGVGGPKQMGYKFGTKIGFQLSDKFELGTGLFLSQKKFSGNGSQFTITEGWQDDIMPMIMEAKCNIIEIPLDLNYHFSGVGNSGFVAGLGLRSFMLHSEWYGFEYSPSDYKPGLKEEIVTDNAQNKNWVGSLELSLGYTRRVSNHLSIQVVPYLQIPVTGIGEGKVDLYSGGIQFAARFGGKN